MAAVGAVQVQCPECDVVLPIAMVVKPADREGNTLIVGVAPDLTDVMAQAWTHEADIEVGRSSREPGNRSRP